MRSPSAKQLAQHSFERRDALALLLPVAGVSAIRWVSGEVLNFALKRVGVVRIGRPNLLTLPRHHTTAAGARCVGTAVGGVLIEGGKTVENASLVVGRGSKVEELMTMRDCARDKVRRQFTYLSGHIRDYTKLVCRVHRESNFSAEDSVIRGIAVTGIEASSLGRASLQEASITATAGSTGTGRKAQNDGMIEFADRTMRALVWIISTQMRRGKSSLGLLPPLARFGTGRMLIKIATFKSMKMPPMECRRRPVYKERVSNQRQRTTTTNCASGYQSQYDQCYRSE